MASETRYNGNVSPGERREILERVFGREGLRPTKENVHRVFEAHRRYEQTLVALDHPNDPDVELLTGDPAQEGNLDRAVIAHRRYDDLRRSVDLPVDPDVRLVCA